MKPEVTVALQGHIKNLVAAKISGAKNIEIMPSRDRLVRMLASPPHEFPPDVPQRERYVSLVRKQFAIQEVQRPIMPQVSSPIPSFTRPLVVLSVATNSSDRNYPTAKWREVGIQLVARGFEVGIIGSPGSEVPKIEGAHDWVGKHSLRETMGVIATSALHIGGDTGTGHIAGAYGVKTVVMYGPTSESKYQPAGAPSIALRNGTNPADVEVDEVVAAAAELLPVTVGA